MLQMSRPVQVLLLCTAVFAVAWFMFLRPKPVGPAAGAQVTAPPGQVGPTGGAAGTGKANTSLGKTVDKAVAGANTAGQDAARAAGTNPGGTTSTPTPAPTTSPTSPSPAPTTGPPPAAKTGAVKGLPTPVARALDKKKVILLLFWNPGSADDKAVRGELRQVKTRGGEVYIASAPISQLARYSAITRGVQVLQAPTIVVVDPKRQASTITGYTDATVIDQAVSDAIAASKKKS